MSDTAAPRPRSFDLLDVICAAAENWKLLTLAPLLIGFVMYLTLLVIPSRFRSEAYLTLKEPDARTAESWTRSPAAADLVTAKFPMVVVDHAASEKTRRRINERIRWRVPDGTTRANSSLFIFGYEDPDAARAQAIATLLIDEYVKASRPRPDAKAALEARLKRAEEQFALVDAALRRVQAEAPAVTANGPNQGDIAKSYVELLNTRATVSASIEAIRLEIAGTSRDIIAVAPTLPQEPVWPPRGLLAGLAALLSALCLVFFVLIRAGLQSVGQTPEGAAKLARLRNAFR